MPKGIVKTEEEINQLSADKQISRKRDSLRICASDAQNRADNWVERSSADPSDETAKIMVPRSQEKADAALARFRAFAKENPARARKAPAKTETAGPVENIDEMVTKLTDAPKAKGKRVRKPLTDEQKAARNEKARAKRAAKKAAAAA